MIYVLARCPDGTPAPRGTRILAGTGTAVEGIPSTGMLSSPAHVGPGDWTPTPPTPDAVLEIVNEVAVWRLPERAVVRASSGRDTRGEGLQPKFTVTRTDGSGEPGGNHEDCQYLVLDMARGCDPIATYAAAEYAQVARVLGYEQLAGDIEALLVEKTEGTAEHLDYYDGPCACDECKADSV